MDTARKNSQEWNAFVAAHGPRSGAFLHTVEWARFKQALGARVRYERIEEDGALKGIALLLERKIPFGQRYFICPRGPITADGEGSQLRAWTERIGKDSGALFIRVEPPVQKAAFKMGGAFKKSIDIHPADTILTDLTQSEETLLDAMHKKTRYNIRLAGRKGIEVSRVVADEMDAVWRLFEKTSARGKFHLHSKAYYQQMLEALQSTEVQAFLSVAKREGKVIAANIMIDHAGTRTYLHGASDHAQRKYMAPYLLHWELMKEAKAAGLHTYDWWGVAPEGERHHPWAGITRFKEGFGGQRISYVGTVDVVPRPVAYKLYALARILRRRFR